MDKITSSTVSVLMAIIGLATLAVIVSRNSNTTGVVTSLGNAFSGSLMAAMSPVSGGGGISVPTPRFSASGGFS